MRSRLKVISALAIFALLLSLLSGCVLRAWRFGDYEHLENAERLMREAKYGEAIAEYRAHIQHRLSIKKRPEWENPYFYLLMIGDLQLNQNDQAAALQSYEEAEKQGVEKSLVSDRYRYVATWHEQHGRIREAMSILVQYRDRDTLLFDVILDRLAKESTQLEDRANLTPAPTP